MPPSTSSPPAYRHHHRKRHSAGAAAADDDYSTCPSPRRRRRSAALLGVRSFGLRLALASAPPNHHRRRRRRRRVQRHLHDASVPLRLRRSSIIISLHLPIFRPFCLRYLVAAGTLGPRRRCRRKSPLVGMGNFVSLLFGKSSGDGAPEAYRSELPAVEGNLHLWKVPSADRPEEDHLQELFKPLTDEEESEVNNILCGSDYSKKIIVMHEPSNIEITKEKFWCLRIRGWLNDEVINLYLELLKERAEREPERFLKCHFFNTFFCKKEKIQVAGQRQGKSNRTSMSRLGTDEAKVSSLHYDTCITHKLC